MKVLLIKDVYKLGRAGEVKKVAAGYGRNYLLPKGFAIPATPGSLTQAERIKTKATERRAVLNEELGSVAEVLNGKVLRFGVKASETGRLYGSVSADDILKAVHSNFEIEIERRQIEMEPIRLLGTHTIPIHLTMDLVPELNVIVHREGEAIEEQTETEVPVALEEESVQSVPDSFAIEEVAVMAESDLTEDEVEDAEPSPEDSDTPEA